MPSKRLLTNDSTIAVWRRGLQNTRITDVKGALEFGLLNLHDSLYSGRRWVKTLPGWGRRQGSSPQSGYFGPPQYSHLASSLLVKCTEIITKTKACTDQNSVSTIQYVVYLH